MNLERLYGMGFVFQHAELDRIVTTLRYLNASHIIASPISVAFQELK